MDTLMIVVNFNDVLSTRQCLDSVRHQARIVVWDNASSDRSSDIIEDLYPDVTVHRSPENVLWTPALVSAIDQYLEEETYIMVSNNDIIYRPDTIRRLKRVAAMETTGIVAPVGSALGGMQDFGTHHGKGRRMPDSYIDGLPDLRAAFVVGASAMLRTEVYHEIGPFDVTMPLGADDHDYCIRLKDAGYHIMVCQSAYVRHKGHASGDRAKQEWRLWGGVSWGAFNEKWAGYFYDDEEAIKCHWGAQYNPGWDYGTGWLTDADRQKVWEARAIHT